MERAKIGSLEWLPLYQGVKESEDPTKPPVPAGLGITTDKAYEGIEVAIRYVGPEVADRWGYRQSQLHLEEARRLADLRRGLDPTIAPGLFAAAANTPEGQESWAGFAAEVIRAAIPEIRGPIDPPVTHPWELLLELPLVERLRLMRVCVATQTPTRRQFFRPADPGDLRPPGPPDRQP